MSRIVRKSIESNVTPYRSAILKLWNVIKVCRFYFHQHQGYQGKRTGYRTQGEGESERTTHTVSIEFEASGIDEHSNFR